MSKQNELSEKYAIIPEDLGKKVNSVLFLVRKHETFENNLVTLKGQETGRAKLSGAKVQLLCSYVKEHYEELHPKSDKPNPKRRLREAWNKAAVVMGSQGFPLSRGKKSPGDHLRDLWQKMLSRAKKYRDERAMTGGGPRPKYSQRHEMVLQAIPSACNRGFKGIGAKAGCITENSTATDATSMGTLPRIARQLETKICATAAGNLGTSPTLTRTRTQEWISESAEQSSEREIFAAWLRSVVHQVPSKHFRSFQTEVFGISMKYLQSTSSSEVSNTTEPSSAASGGSQGIQQPDLPPAATFTPATRRCGSQPRSSCSQSQAPDALLHQPPPPPISQPSGGISAGTTAGVISQATPVDQDEEDADDISPVSSPVIPLDMGCV
ncbi:uncharacterized protein [Diadema antillarum]|uniref:uncharacterized protein n=1 Tax=Diadema antillarum TaxID=105358 RepID=UPI003A89DD6F